MCRVADAPSLPQAGGEASAQIVQLLIGPRFIGSKHQRRASVDDKTTEVSIRKRHLQAIDPCFMTRWINTINLKVLNLSFNKLVKLPQAVTLLANLEELYANDNELTCLPADINKLTRLRVLDCSNNRLAELPETLTQCTQLQVLRAGSVGGGNMLRALPESMGDLANLREAHFDNNELEALPASITRLRNLRALTAKRNRLAALPDGMERMVSLEWVDISFNMVSTLPAGIAGIRSLRMLNVSFNALQSIACELTRGDAGNGDTHHVNLVLCGNPLLSSETAAIPLTRPVQPKHRISSASSLLEAALKAAIAAVRTRRVSREAIEALPPELQDLLQHAPKCSACGKACTQSLCEPHVVRLRAAGYSNLPVVVSTVCQQCNL